MHINCPHCHNGVEVVEEHSLSDLDCPSCGSHFSLINDEDVNSTLPGHTHKTLGRFQLVNEVGKGAFGSVWRGNDPQLDRAVAIKIPRKGQLTKTESEQFFREARAVAQLKHPNIVPVHEIGKDGETIYIVSDFVQGFSLADRLSAGPMPMRESAQLCIKVCNALQHAHDKGVIHRDLKPANIMLDSDGEPHVMDFGLAKREAGEITMTMDGQILGTPAYMSPEQAKGSGHGVDGRTDLYSVGVILFQLLTGELPFRGNMRMLIHQVINEEAPSPLALNSNLDKDLSTIVTKCLEKELDKRYSTTNELANDLQRYLDGMPISARPISKISRVIRWSKRKPALAWSLGSLSLLLLGLGIGGPIVAIQQTSLTRKANEATQLALVETERAKRQTEKANEQTLRADKQAAVALEQKNRAQFAEDEMIKRNAELLEVSEFQEDRLSEVDPEAMGETIAESVRQQLAKIHVSSKQDSEIESDPKSEKRLQEITKSLERINFTDVARESLVTAIFEPATNAARTKFANQPLLKASLLQSIAASERKLGLYKQALAPQKEALEIRQQELGKLAYLTISSMSHLGGLLNDLDRADDAIQTLELALKICEEDTTGDLEPQFISLLNNLGSVLNKNDRPNEALKYMEKSLTLQKSLGGEDNSTTYTFMINLADTYQRQGKLDKAIPMQIDAVEGLRKTIGDLDVITLIALDNLGSMMRKTKRFDEAEKLCLEAYEGTSTTLGETHLTTLRVLRNLCQLKIDQGETESAKELAMKAWTGLNSEIGPMRTESLLAESTLVNLLINSHDEDGIANLMPVLATRVEAFETSDNPNLGILMLTAKTYRKLDKVDEAITLFKRVVKLSTEKNGSDDAHTISALKNLIEVCSQNKRFEEAIEPMQSLILAKINLLGGNHEEVLAWMDSLGKIYAQANKPAKAAELYSKILSIRKSNANSNPLVIDNLMNDLGFAYWRSKQFDQAIELYIELVSRMEEQHGRDHSSTQIAIANLGVNYCDSNEFEKGLPLLEEASAKGVDWAKAAIEAAVKKKKNLSEQDD